MCVSFDRAYPARPRHVRIVRRLHTLSKVSKANFDAGGSAEAERDGAFDDPTQNVEFAFSDKDMEHKGSLRANFQRHCKDRHKSLFEETFSEECKSKSSLSLDVGKVRRLASPGLSPFLFENIVF